MLDMVTMQLWYAVSSVWVGWGYKLTLKCEQFGKLLEK